jgi:hypothetical protein
MEINRIAVYERCSVAAAIFEVVIREMGGTAA